MFAFLHFLLFSYSTFDQKSIIVFHLDYFEIDEEKNAYLKTSNFFVLTTAIICDVIFYKKQGVEK